MRRPWTLTYFLALSLISTSARAQTPETKSLPQPGPVGAAVQTEEPKVNAQPATAGVAAQDSDSKTPPLPTAAVSSVPQEDCSEGSGFYGNAEFLLWWFRQSPLPPLATHGNIADTPTGALGKKGTEVLFGGSDAGSNPFSGARFTAGYWLDNDRTVGVEASFFFLEQRRLLFSAASSGGRGTGSLDIPFFNADGNFNDALQVAVAGNNSGFIHIALIQRLLGAETNVRFGGAAGDNWSLSWLAGFRFLDMEETLDLNAHAALLPAGAGVTATLFESFAARNHFYGGQVGFDASYDWTEKLRVNIWGKLALGDNCQEVRINGTTVNKDPIHGTVVSPGGLFVGPNNIGNHQRSAFSVLPEIGVNLGYRLTNQWTATVGYDFLYLSNVVRPGNQIDQSVNFQPTTGTSHPIMTFHNSDFWAQGITFGLEYRY